MRGIPQRRWGFAGRFSPEPVDANWALRVLSLSQTSTAMQRIEGVPRERPALQSLLEDIRLTVSASEEFITNCCSFSRGHLYSPSSHDPGFGLIAARLGIAASDAWILSSELTLPIAASWSL